MRNTAFVVIATAAAALAMGHGPARAAETGAIAVLGAWSRPVAAGLGTGVAYLTLRNGGHAADRLMDATTPVAARVSLHHSMAMGGMMSMTPVDGGLPLAPGSTVALAPGGYHLMLEGLKGGLRRGTRYPLTLRFAKAAPQTVEVQVRDSAP